MTAEQGVSQLRAESEPGRREKDVGRWVVFVVVSIALLMGSIDSTIVATALPTLHKALHAKINWAGWIVTGYTLGQVVAMPLAGRIGDQYGRKQLFLASLILFTVTSLLCGLSNSIYELVPLRVVQAFGGGAFLPSAIGIIADRFGEDRGKAIGMTSSIFPIGALIGPVLGGLFINYWSWRGIFFINVPIGIGLLLVAPRLINRTEPKSGAHTDFIGLSYLAITILAIMFAITELGNGHTKAWSPVVLACAGAFVVGVIGFGRRQRRVEVPIIPVGLIGGKGFLVMNYINFVYGACVFGIASLIPLYAQDRYHLSVLQSGTLLTARAIGTIVIATLASFLLARTGYRVPMLIGISVVAIAFFLIGMRALALGPYWWLSIAATLQGLAFGLAAPATNNAMLALAPDDVGAITGLRGVFRMSGSIIVVSIATSIAARSSNPGIALSHVFYGIVAVLVITLPFILRVPEHRGTW